jgi:hypothetical protein
MGGEFVTRGGGPSTRTTLINQINEAFNRRSVEATAQRLGNIGRTGDFLDICERLGFLSEIHGGDFAGYKQGLSMPEVNQGLVTAAFRMALTGGPAPIPLRILIVSGTHEIITVTGTQTEVSIVVTRDERRGAPRKRAAARKK